MHQSLPNGSAPSRRDMLKTSAVSAATIAAAVGCATIPTAVHAAGNDEIRVGLIGCGGRGSGAAQNALESSPNVKLVALGDLFQDQMDLALPKFQKYGDKFAVPKEQMFVGWDAYKKVLETNCNYVILATPPGFRPMMIEAAVAAGKHVFAEKPAAIDPAGVRRVMAAGEVAAQKGLGLVAGTQRRHQRSYMETIKRIHDGEIGDLIAGQGYWLQGSLWNKTRQPAWSDMEYQLRNWLYFVWLSGDHIVEQHMHQHDVMNWVMKGPPKMCHGVGGRMVRTGPEYGHIYDFFAIEYEYANGVKVLSMCRQIENTRTLIGERVQGTKGSAIPESSIFDAAGKRTWKYTAPEELEEKPEELNPYMLEHRDLIASIRAGKPLNEAKQTAESAMTAIMGRMAAYSGQLVTFASAMKDPLDTFPKKLEFGPLEVPPVALPGKRG